MLAPLQKLVASLRDDLRDGLDGKTDEPPARRAELAAARDRVRNEYDDTRKAERTAQAFPAWREDYLTQVAVAWVLACVFVRYLEDNAFVADCWLGGPDDPRRDDGNVPTFARPDGDTEFLGDLYQGLSEDVRKRYALLQTPHFVREFILDRTLDPACDAFGFHHARLIDPTCGSGHFLLGAFDRLMRRWRDHYHELTGRD